MAIKLNHNNVNLWSNLSALLEIHNVRFALYLILYKYKWGLNMELCLFMVENYRNIKNQGFNFSPRFSCKYNDKTLTINENKDYIDIFPENINITAIVGKNGSGKSNILKFIFTNKLSIKVLFYFMKKNTFFIFLRI